MSNETYNGWEGKGNRGSAYATWRVNLELFDGQRAADFDLQHETPYGAGRALKEYVEETIEMSTTEGIARDYAYAFLSDVNWQEIAQHLIDADNEA